MGERRSSKRRKPTALAFHQAWLAYVSIVDDRPHAIEPGLHGSFEGCIAGGEVTDVQDFFVDIGQEEVDEAGDLGFLLHDRGIGVDEERSSEGIFVVLGGLCRGGDTVDGDGLDQVFVLGEVGIAEVTDGVGLPATPWTRTLSSSENWMLAAERMWLRLVGVFRRLGP